MEWIILLIKIMLGIFIIDRIGLWLEARGYVYWRKKPSNGGMGNALEEFNSFLNPSVKHHIELKQSEAELREDQGDGLNPGSRNH